jgi:hypothetical protein
VKRVVIVVAAVTVMVAGYFILERRNDCEDWQERYSDFIGEEMMKQSPRILNEDLIEEEIGPRPEGCSIPDRIAG